MRAIATNSIQLTFIVFVWLAVKESVHALFDVVLLKLKAIDVDQEVKEKSITAMASVIATVGDELAASLSLCWPLFLSRLQNEVPKFVPFAVYPRR